MSTETYTDTITRGPSRWINVEEAQTLRTRLLQDLASAELVGDVERGTKLAVAVGTLDAMLLAPWDDQVELMPIGALWDEARGRGYVE